MKFYLISLSVVLSSFLGACSNSSAQSTEQTQTTPTKEEPRVEGATKTATDLPIFHTFDDIAYIFEQKNDTTYLINFWATWCAPCVKELPYFEQIQETYKEDKVKVILVSLDFAKDIERKLIPFMEKKQLQSEVLVLIDGKYNDWIDRVSEEWGGAIPATVVYKGEKRTFIGEEFANYEELNTLLKSFL